MKTMINSDMATIPAGRIVKYADRAFLLHTIINGGGAPLNVTTGFNTLTAARGQIRVTAKMLSQAVKLQLRSASPEGNEDVLLAMGDTTPITRNTFLSALRSVKTDLATGMGSTLELHMLLNNAAKQAVNKDTRLVGVTRADGAVDAKIDVYTDGDTGVPVEFVEMVATPGKFLVSDANGKARYYDPATDTGAEIIARLETDMIEVISAKKFVRIQIAIQPG